MVKTRKRKPTRDTYLCGDFVMSSPENGLWHDLGYAGIMHKCESCSNAARYGLRDGKRERYKCKRCVEALSAR